MLATLFVAVLCSFASDGKITAKKELSFKELLKLADKVATEDAQPLPQYSVEPNHLHWYVPKPVDVYIPDHGVARLLPWAERLEGYTYRYSCDLALQRMS
jgi:hypothetical protein